MESFSADEFIEGFTEESREHLTSVRHNLLLLEESLSGSNSAERARVRVNTLSELFRSFHTIKGLAGMVGLSSVANLAHALETVLQLLQQGRLEITSRVVDRLLTATRTLESLVRAVEEDPTAATRPDADLPDIEPDLAALQALQQPADPGSTAGPAGGQSAPLEVILSRLGAYPDMLKMLGETERIKLRAALEAGQGFWLVLFAPSAEKSARGLNVDFIRHQLQQWGDLIRAAPILQQGAVRFAFLLATEQPLPESELEVDEIVPLAEAATPSSAEGQTLALPTEAAAPALTQPPLEPPEAPVVPAAGAAFDVRLPSSVRVELERLDDLMNYVSDLVVLRGRMEDGLSRLDGAVPRDLQRHLRQVQQQNGRVLRNLRRAVMRARLVPLSESFNHMPLVVRDLVRSTGKEVHLQMEGETTEVDKALVERLLDPLIHLVRNALIHGFEPPEERLALGKPRQGTLLLSGIQQSENVVVTVADDGRGIDLQLVARKAAQLGWLAPGQAVEVPQALEFITRAGFSTREQADLAAGRGIGLDVVIRMVRSFGGSLEMETTPGQGTAFHLRMPITLMMFEAFIVGALGPDQTHERYAIPRHAVEEVRQIDPADIVRLESGELLAYQGRLLVVRRLSALLNADPPVSSPATAHPYGLICSEGHQSAALLVDSLLGLREVVARAITDPLVAQPYLLGATELGDGQIVLILDPAALLLHTKGRS